MASLDPVTAVSDLLNTIIARTIKDPTQIALASDELSKMRESGDLQLALAQISVNQTEAASPRLFVAGWRPCLAWVCLLDVFYETFAQPILAPYIHVASAAAISITMPILLTLIGARTVDKWQGTDTK